jgi:hypothetical protein
MKSLAIIGGNPTGDLAGKTIDSCTVRLTNTHSWYNSGCTVVLGYTSNTSVPSTFNGSGITGVKNYQIGENATLTTNAGTGLGNALKSGAAQALCLGPGSPAFNLQNYGLFYGAGGSNNSNPLITVNWHTGSAPVAAGNGANGVIHVTYTTTSLLVAALSPVANADAAGNAYGVGYTGPVQAFHPGSNPSTVEAWVNVTPPAGWSGVNRYKRIAEANCIMVDIQCTHAGATGAVTFMTLPTGYFPIANKTEVLTITNNSVPASQLWRMTFNSTGAVNTYALPANTTGVFGTWIVPLD